MKIRFDYHEQKPKLNELPKKDDQTIVNLGSINNKLNPPNNQLPPLNHDPT